VLVDLRSPDFSTRVRAAHTLFKELPSEFRGLGPLHHVGFISGIPSWKWIHDYGFRLEEMYESKRVARDLGVPTMVRRYHHVEEVLEFFVPEAPMEQIKSWVVEGRALHMAFKATDIRTAPAGWVPQGEPVEVSGCRVLYYAKTEVPCLLELFQSIGV